MILRLTVSVEHRLVTDRQTDRHKTTAYTALAWRRAVKTRTKPVHLCRLSKPLNDTERCTAADGGGGGRNDDDDDD